MATVDILLASYNGERYIREQLDSILAQTWRDFRILIRDDGSTDATPAIIREYEARYPGVVEAVSDGAARRGPAANFFQLMKRATADYAMFADQDDYWLPEKTETLLEEMRRVEARAGADRPALVFSDCEVVDAVLRPLSLNKKNMQTARAAVNLQFNRLLVQNYVRGCQAMVNRSLYRAMGDYAEGIVMHDWWAALYAGARGAIGYVPRALMLYRQHGDNCAGAQDIRRFRYRLKKFMDPATKDAKFTYLRQALLFRDRYGGTLDAEVRGQLDGFIALYGYTSKLARVRALLRGGYLKSDWARVLGQVLYL